jgi:hypothetical protein
MSGEYCARVLCSERASAILLINARDLSAQIVDIQEETGIAGVRLCRIHADAVVVPLGWTKEDSRTQTPEPELVLVDDAASELQESSGARRLPTMEEAEEEDMHDAAVGEVPPLLSRAFRAAGLD